MSSSGSIPRSTAPRFALPATLYTYGCDGYDDFGWGCGYRCLQTLISTRDKPPTVPELIAHMGERPGHFADMGDIITYMSTQYGWEAQMLQVSVRSEIHGWLERLASHVRPAPTAAASFPAAPGPLPSAAPHDPPRVYTWALLVGGGLMLLVADVDVPRGRVQVFDPHGPNDGSGMTELKGSDIGHGGFGWIDAHDLLLGCVSPDVRACVGNDAWGDEDALLAGMNWAALVFAPKDTDA